MRYILLLYGDEKLGENVTPEEWNNIMVAHQNWTEEAERRGFKPTGEALHGTNQAKSVRFEGNQATLTTDGPFAETKEQLGGFYVLHCEESEALEMAAKLPTYDGTVEVRLVMEFG